MILHSNQFEVNEAWILFQVTRRPVITGDGPAVLFGLMDAASCFLLYATAFPGINSEVLSKTIMIEMFKNAFVHKSDYPKKLFVPEEILNDAVSSAAEDLNIPVICVDESQILPIIKEAQDDFTKKLCRS